MRGHYVSFGNEGHQGSPYSNPSYSRMGKRGQMKIQQMAFVLMAVTLFFVLVGMFVLIISFSGVREKATLLAEENAILLVSKIANSAEFACGKSIGTNCIDADKVMALKENIGKYSDFWQVESLEIRKVSSESEGIECNTANYPDCDTISLIEGEGIGVSNFVSLCRKESLGGDSYDKCEIAKIIVSYEVLS